MKKVLYILIILSFTACNYTETKENIEIQLSSDWTLTRVKTGDSFTASVPGCVHTDLLANDVIEDPFFRTNEKDLQWIDKEDWSYKTVFEINDETLGYSRIQLNFKGLDTYADIYINDSLLAKTDNMFRDWIFNCKPFLKSGKNSLKVYLRSPVTVGLEKLEANGYPLPASNDQSENGELGNKKVSIFTRKAPYHYGWDWGPRFVTSGIWKPVYLKAWNSVKLNNVQIIQEELNENKAKLKEIISLESQSEENITIKIKYQDKTLKEKRVNLTEGQHSIELNFEIDDPKLWQTNGLGDQHLYKIESSIIINKKEVQKTKTSIGLRTVKLIQKEDSAGRSFYFELNGEPVFMKGANHIPNDIFLTRVTDEIYEREIKSAAESGMNMIRVWGGGIYENDIFYELCNKYGILVWQDFMFACSMYPGQDDFIENIKQEAIDNVIRLRNHPCVALWCGNNEIDAAWSQYSKGGWGWKKRYNDDQRKEIWANYEKIFHKVLPEIVKSYDPTRTYWPSSPMAGPKEHASYSTYSGDMHYWGVWHGKEPFSEFITKRARFMSEYGFQSFPEFKTVKKYALPEDFNIESEVMTAHQRSGIGNIRIKEYMSRYYNNPKDFESFLYVGQVLQAEGIKSAIEAHRRDMPFNMGTLYWQLNDCWPVASWSSMDYYGNWKALQYYVKKAFNNILISPVIEKNVLKCYVISDEHNDKNDAVLKIMIYKLDGTLINSEESKVNIKANSSRVIFSMPVNDLMKKSSFKESLCYLSLSKNNKLISDNFLYFDEIKNLKLKKPNIKYNIHKKAEGFEIQLKTNEPAKNVYLYFEEDNGFFSDNYFDLIPGKTVNIIYKPNKSEFNPESELKIMTIYDSYSE